jgi:hypothetical protein
MYPVWFTECALVLRVLISVDKDNLSGVKNEGQRNRVRIEWLDPLIQKVGLMHQELATGNVKIGMEAEFVLQRWDDALIRALECIRDIEKS